MYNLGRSLWTSTHAYAAEAVAKAASILEVIEIAIGKRLGCSYHEQLVSSTKRESTYGSVIDDFVFKIL